jgi:hypothetical protein
MPKYVSWCLATLLAVVRYGMQWHYYDHRTAQKEWSVPPEQIWKRQESIPGPELKKLLELGRQAYKTGTSHRQQSTMFLWLACHSRHGRSTRTLTSSTIAVFIFSCSSIDESAVPPCLQCLPAGLKVSPGMYKLLLLRRTHTKWRTGEDDQRGVNGSQSKFLIGIWSMSQNQPEITLF